MKHGNKVFGYMRTLRGSIASVLTIALFAFFIVVSIFVLLYQSRVDTGIIIADDIAKLANIFERIEQTCDIVSFEYQKNPINFLNIKKDGFVGSELGSMNIAHPDKWEGPYLEENLKMQGKNYQIVRTNLGYFITPGQGVKLPNGNVVGKDIVFNDHADIASMTRDKNLLLFENRVLAMPLALKSLPLALIMYEEDPGV